MNIFSRQLLLWDEIGEQLDEAEDTLNHVIQSSEEAVPNFRQQINKFQ